MDLGDLDFEDRRKIACRLGWLSVRSAHLRSNLAHQSSMIEASLSPVFGQEKHGLTLFQQGVEDMHLHMH